MLPMELQNAKFIWLPSLVDEVNTYVMTREVATKTAGKRYIFAVTADSDYALFVGGRLVTGRQYADYPFYKVYDRVDITDALADGENALTIIGFCANEDSSTYKKSVPGIAYALWEDGCELFHTSEATKMAVHPCYKSGRVDKVTGQLGFSFEYDGRNPEPVWETPVVTHVFDTLYPRPVEKLVWEPATAGKIVAHGSFREASGYRNMGERVQFASLSMRERRYFDVPMGEGKAVASTYPYRPASTADISLTRADGEDGVWCVVDIGREESGMFTLDIDLPHEAELMIGWGEHLDDMRVRAEVGTRNFACHVTLPAGHTEFVHPFLRMGCRYLEIHVYAESAVLHHAGIIPTNYPVTDHVEFHCADTMHNRIYETCLRTLLLCMHEHYEDCPWREQALYSMDSRNQMLCGYYTFREKRFAKASLRLLGLSIRDDDTLELCAPAKVTITIPSFCAVYAVQMWEYVLYTGDVAFGREMLPVIERLCGKFVTRTAENGLLPLFPEKEYWNFYEWQPGLAGSIGTVDTDITYDLPLCGFVTMAYDSLAKLCGVLGEADKQAQWASRAEAMKASAHAAFYDADAHRYYSFIRVDTDERFHLSQLSNALAIYSGICPESCVDEALEALAYDRGMIPVTFSHGIFRYDALMRRPEKYARFVFREIADQWGEMLHQNATTFWETSLGKTDFGHAGSLCHGWAAIPAYLYFRYLVGIAPDAPGHMAQPCPLSEKLTGIYEVECNY